MEKDNIWNLRFFPSFDHGKKDSAHISVSRLKKKRELFHWFTFVEWMKCPLHQMLAPIKSKKATIVTGFPLLTSIRWRYINLIELVTSKANGIACERMHSYQWIQLKRWRFSKILSKTLKYVNLCDEQHAIRN